MDIGPPIRGLDPLQREGVRLQVATRRSSGTSIGRVQERDLATHGADSEDPIAGFLESPDHVAGRFETDAGEAVVEFDE